MLPVQTVMIRYMVLVYRWGRGGWARWVIGRALRAVLWRADALAGGYSRRRTWRGREKAPPTWGRRGLLEAGAIRFCLIPVWARAKVQGRKAHNPQE